MLAQTIVEAPNQGASSRAAAISVPSAAAPTVNTTVATTHGCGAVGWAVPDDISGRRL